jgi:hypothetical protein
MSLPEEYIILRQSRLSVPVVAYFLSRSVIPSDFKFYDRSQRCSVGTMGFVVTSSTFQGDCSKFPCS